jgi:hypothetical protein
VNSPFRITRLDDEGAPIEQLPSASGVLTLPGGAGVRLYAVEGAIRLR